LEVYGFSGNATGVDPALKVTNPSRHLRRMHVFGGRICFKRKRERICLHKYRSLRFGDRSYGGQKHAAIFCQGNVGIGTTTPSVKLDVSGGIRSRLRFGRDDM